MTNRTIGNIMLLTFFTALYSFIAIFHGHLVASGIYLLTIILTLFLVTAIVLSSGGDLNNAKTFIKEIFFSEVKR